MFCPKCGQQNPEAGKFCRSCGTDLGNVSSALAGVPQAKPPVDRRGREIGWESVMTQVFMGFAFLIVSIILGISGKGGGWWFWMLIPAFGMLGSGIAKWIQLKKLEQAGAGIVPVAGQAIAGAAANLVLPPPQTEFVTPAESRYKTGDLVPPSVTESTTRHLEIDNEGQTMALPKK